MLKAGDGLETAFGTFDQKYVVLVACLIVAVIIALLLICALCVCWKPDKTLRSVVPTDQVDIPD